MSDHQHGHSHDDGHDHSHGPGPDEGHDFDQKAATWDDDPAKVERAQIVAEAIKAAVTLDPAMRLLEYGAGTGLATQALQDAVGPVTLADTSAGMRAEMEKKVATGLLPATARVVDWDLSSGDSLSGDILSGDAPHEQFDLIVTVLVLHHIEPLAPVLDAFAALLAPGGHLCVIDLEAEDGSFHGDGFSGHHGFDTDDLSDQLRAAGFNEVTTSRVYEMDRGGVPYGVFLAVATA